MADLDPDDIKDEDEDKPEEELPPPATADPTPPPAEEPKEETPLEHLANAVAELARASGSPPQVMARLEKVREALKK
jgi:hypothetical protein